MGIKKRCVYIIADTVQIGSLLSLGLLAFMQCAAKQSTYHRISETALQEFMLVAAFLGWATAELKFKLRKRK